MGALLGCIIAIQLLVIYLMVRFYSSRAGYDKEIINSLRDGILIVSADGTICYSNATAPALLGRYERTLKGQKLTNLLSDTQKLKWGETSQLFSRAKRTSSEWGTVDITPLKLTPDRKILLIHAEYATTIPLSETERHKRSPYSSKIGIWDWEVGTNRLYWSDAVYGMFGYNAGEVEPSYSFYYEKIHPDDRKRVLEVENHCLENDPILDEEYRVIWEDGSIHWLRETGNVVFDENDQPVKITGVVREITEEKNHQIVLEKRANNDPLTDLHNRTAFETRLGEILKEAKLYKSSCVAVIFIDLDKFKQVNDGHGHAEGDLVLVEVANRMAELLRDEAHTIARVGGDEFVVLSNIYDNPLSLNDYLFRVCPKIFSTISQPINIAERIHHVGASLGVSIYPDHGVNVDGLIHVADEAMYQSKNSNVDEFYVAKEGYPL